MANIYPFRITADQLTGLDKKTRIGLQPLLDALYTTIQQTVAAGAAQIQDQLVSFPLTTGAAVTDSFPLVFKSTIVKPQVVTLANIIPKDVAHVLTAPFVVQGFRITDAGLISIPWITNLLANNTYQLTFWVR